MIAQAMTRISGLTLLASFTIHGTENRNGELNSPGDLNGEMEAMPTSMPFQIKLLTELATSIRKSLLLQQTLIEARPF